MLLDLFLEYVKVNSGFVVRLLRFGLHLFIELEHVNLVLHDQMGKFEQALLNIGETVLLHSYAIGMQTAVVFLASDEPAAVLIKDEHQTAEFLWRQSQPDLGDHTAKIVSLDTVLVAAVSDAEDCLRSDPHSLDARQKGLHDSNLSSQSIHVSFCPLLVKLVGAAIAHQVPVLCANCDPVDLFLKELVLVLQILDLLVLFDDLQLENLHHVLVVLNCPRLLAHHFEFIFFGLRIIHMLVTFICLDL